jgi:RNA polymerase sigma-70 factor (ECF subfamily)
LFIETMANATLLNPAGTRLAGDPDYALVARFQAGDDAAFDTLVGRHEEFIYNVCMGIVSSPEDAEDAMQETFLAAYRALKKFRGDSKVSTWLYRIAVRECLDISRRRKPASSLEEIIVEPSVDDGADGRATESLVRSSLAMLPEHYRTALILRYYGGLSYEEIASAMNSTAGRVKMMLHRARKAFQGVWPGDSADAPLASGGDSNEDV